MFLQTIAVVMWSFWRLHGYIPEAEVQLLSIYYAFIDTRALFLLNFSRLERAGAAGGEADASCGGLLQP